VTAENNFGHGIIAEGACMDVQGGTIAGNSGSGLFSTLEAYGAVSKVIFKSNISDGVTLSAGANPSITKCTISENEHGVCVVEHAKGLIEDNDISDNKGDGVFVATNAEPQVKANRIKDGRRHGVCVQENAGGTFSNNNEICNNRGDGVRIFKGAYPTVADNAIEANAGSGFSLSDGAKATLSMNQVSHNSW
jgi:parallel beta-helix repeat protein